MKKLIFGLLLASFAHGALLGTAFNYNGRLNDGAGPANGRYDLRFILYNASIGGSQAGPIVTNASVVASNGLFSTAVDFGEGIWSGTPYWIELGVRTNSSPDDFATLSPRQRVAPTPYAIFASEAGEASSLITGTYSNEVTFNNGSSTFSGAFTGNGSGLTTLNASRLTAGTVPDARLAVNVARLNSNQTYSGAVTLSNTANVISGTFTGNASGLTGLSAANISSGTVPDARLSANVARLNGNQTFTGANTFNPASGAPFSVGITTKVSNLNADLLDGLDSSKLWKQGGNSGTISTNDFIGTTDDEPFEIRVLSGRAALFEAAIKPNTWGGSNYSVNVVLGTRLNSVFPGVVGATISGGGYYWTGHALGAAGWHTIGSNANFGTIGGGTGNHIHRNAEAGTISGGELNDVYEEASYSTIGGGYDNTIFRDSLYATISGGDRNIVSGSHAVVPGGERNNASGSHSFAAGERAIATHNHSFVWSDSYLASERDNEFAISAAGGVRIQSDRGISLHAADRPLITRSFDLFTSGNYSGLGRWGLFMEPHAITLGMPAVAAKKIRFAKYNADSTWTELGVIDQNGDLFLMGTVNPPSDRKVKTNFAATDTRKILEHLLKLSIQTWSYTNNAAVRHIGPVAQDFHEAFNVGADDKHISTIDADGVALAAVQGLNQKLEEKLRDKELELRTLKERFSRLERLILNRAGQNSEEDK